ncbi:PRC and DUF2382 domain-containing protein [Corynebacterium guangdongense]|uniref:Uncharacterized protein (TIGR02271 family) n=1 Tax=Corynebacterium guangdongense TaxID=1783348 RepID=A0ABU2A181_9CORY|nr:PRC and DUF2382 domain-containing protein [Corynebacterium guangdongense]MDR7330358.1 uncharacterized protein (TIGR02271 family) [Corynebacterium guangdongense]WJZ18916.1 Stress response protein YsnF [Corynebacterium guangdongense]
MATNRQIRELLDATAYDVDGDKLGKVNEVYINDNSGQPDFIEVNHGLFGMSSSLVPLRGHSLENDHLTLAFPKDRIKDAPNLDADAHLSREDQDRLYNHYGLSNTENRTTYHPDYTDDRRRAGFGGTDPEREGWRNQDVATDVNPGRDRDLDRDRDLTGDRDWDRDRTHGVDVDADDNAIVRSEERLHVDKERVNTGEARLRKYVVHDTETVEVPVEREEVRVERTPIDRDAAEGRVGELGEDEASVTLHEDRVTVTKESVPVEKVGLEKTTVRDTETVTEDVAKERVDVDGVDNDSNFTGDRTRNPLDRDRDGNLPGDRTRNPLDRDNDGNLDRDDLRR